MTCKKLGAAAILLNQAGEVLLVKHSYGRLNWELPGGNAEADESIVATALREMREETGLEVRALSTSGIYYEPIDDMHHFVFICEAIDPSATTQRRRDQRLRLLADRRAATSDQRFYDPPHHGCRGQSAAATTSVDPGA